MRLRRVRRARRGAGAETPTADDAARIAECLGHPPYPCISQNLSRESITARGGRRAALSRSLQLSPSHSRREACSHAPSVFMRLCLLGDEICFASLAICTKSSRHRSTRSPTSGSWRFTLPSTIADAQPAHMAITCSTSNVLVMFLICDATSGSILSGFLMAWLTRVGGQAR